MRLNFWKESEDGKGWVATEDMDEAVRYTIEYLANQNPPFTQSISIGRNEVDGWEIPPYKFKSLWASAFASGKKDKVNELRGALMLERLF